MIKLDKYEQQVILACKSWGEWAKREDRFKAVKVVVAQYYALDLEDVNMYSMYNCLLDLFIKINENKPNLFKSFLENIFYKDWCGGYEYEINMEHLVRKLISQISNIAVKDNKGNDYFEELECDYEILNKWI